MEVLDERLEPTSRATVQIGEWRVAPELNQISRGVEVVHLEPKAMAVLMYLASRPSTVASRDELLDSVWPGVIVGDNALTQVVIKLRKALCDTAREPRYIQAISKKGYRLIAPVDRLDGKYRCPVNFLALRLCPLDGLRYGQARRSRCWRVPPLGCLFSRRTKMPHRRPVSSRELNPPR